MIASPSRRAFMGAVLTAAAPGLKTPAAAPARPARRLLTPEQFKQQLQGPIQSNPSPFNADYSVDYEGVANMIARGRKYGVRLFGLTAGNSQYHALTLDEIKEMTRVMVQAAGEDGIVIAASGDWWTGQVVDYARFAESIGADALQVMLPTRADNMDATTGHFRAVADATRLPLVLHGNYSDALLDKLLEIPAIVSMKEDGELARYIDVQIKYGHRVNIYCGGAESRFLVGYPYGAKAFFSTYTTFAPDISMQFWKAIQQDDVKAAVEITKRFDHPFIARFSHPFWHATLEYFGVARRHMRPPQTTYTDAQMAEVKQFFDSQGLDPRRYA